MASNLKSAPATFTSDVIGRLLEIGRPVECHEDNKRSRVLSPDAIHILPNPMRLSGRSVAERYARRAGQPDAEHGSAALLDALRRHHPERCAR